MDILGAAESRLQSIIDENSFIINVLVKDQSKNNSLNELLNAIRQYQSAASQLEIVKNLKSQVQYTTTNSDAKEPT
jgi:hypothetical protein